MKWLIRRCEESETFSWGLTWAGIIGVILIGFAGRV